MLIAFADVTVQQLHDACGNNPGFWCDHVLRWTGSSTAAQLADSLVGTPLAIIAIVVGALILNRILRRIIAKTLEQLREGTVTSHLQAVRHLGSEEAPPPVEVSLRTQKRIAALTSVLRSVTTFTIVLIAALLILGRVGVNLAPLLAGAGVVGVALGFGSQALVRDFLAGIFILVEDQYGVGDIINLDGQTSGVVESVSLRMTRLRSVDGTVWHVPNGDIRRAGNTSQQWSRSLLDIEVAYDTDLRRAKEIIKSVADKAWHEDPTVLEEPEVWGVEQLGASSIVIRLVLKTTPSEQWRINRLLRERIKEAFDEQGIEIPFPQQVVWHRTPPGEGNGGQQSVPGPVPPSTAGGGPSTSSPAPPHTSGEAPDTSGDGSDG